MEAAIALVIAIASVVVLTYGVVDGIVVGISGMLLLFIWLCCVGPGRPRALPAAGTEQGVGLAGVGDGTGWPPAL